METNIYRRLAVVFLLGTILTACSSSDSDTNKQPGNKVLYSEDFESDAYVNAWTFSGNAGHSIDNSDSNTGNGSLHITNPNPTLAYQTAQFAVDNAVAGQTYELILSFKYQGQHMEQTSDYFIEVSQNGAAVSSDPGFRIFPRPANLTNINVDWTQKGIVIQSYDNGALTVTIHSGVSDLWLDDISIELLEQHNDARGCFSSQCHDEGQKSAQHPMSYNDCQFCHTAVNWLPYIAPLDHSQILGTCAAAGCHDGSGATSKPVTHPSTSNSCDACHVISAWSPVVMDHAHVQSLSCVAAACHRLSEKPMLHPITSDLCRVCHTFRNWTFLVLPFDHSHADTNSCATTGCHSVADKSANHPDTPDTCESCHGTATWVPVLAP